MQATDARFALTLAPLRFTEWTEGTQRVTVTWHAAVWVGKVPITKLTAVT